MIVSPSSDQNLVHLSGYVIGMMTYGFSKLTQQRPEQLLIHLFLPLVAKAMSVLHAGQKDNLIYHAARCFGEQCHGLEMLV
jgi:hypothetical protein